MKNSMGIPSRIDEYVTWFNNCFTFATAKAVVSKKGEKSIVLIYN